MTDTGLPTAAELQSGMDRHKWAENLILQLPVEHNGRNSWLLNYGRGDFAKKLRRDRELSFNEQSQAINPPATGLPTDDAMALRTALLALLEFIDHAKNYELEQAHAYKVYQDARKALADTESQS